MPGGFRSTLQLIPPAPPCAQAWPQTWFDQVQEPTGGGYLAFAYGKPQAARFSLVPDLSLSRATSNFIQAPCCACWMVRVGGNGQSVPLPVTGFGALPKPAGRSRAEPQGLSERYARQSQVQGCTSPPSASCFRVAGLLARVPRSSSLRTQTRTGLPKAQKLSTGANGRTYRGYAQWG